MYLKFIKEKSKTQTVGERHWKKSNKLEQNWNGITIKSVNLK